VLGGCFDVVGRAHIPASGIEKKSYKRTTNKR